MANKKAILPRQSDFTKTFLKDWERYNRNGRYDMQRLKQVMLLLIANDASLSAHWRDHELKGQWDNHRECHIGGDFLLIYQIDKTNNFETIIFERIGTHSELFD